ncbi:MAG: ACT domain-containing protein [Pseudomonadota bacterium]|nr:ACT domain-containing protein [Pseudomonadota bacterium]
MSEKLFIIFGTGPDAVGLVQQITTPIAGIRGNIIDLRQDVLHGLFTVFLVVDFEDSEASVAEIETLIGDIGERTGLDLRLDKYQPVARSAEKVNLLLILIGRDRPGIIAAVSDILRNYQVNVEFSQMIARESIFLMELMVDISRSVLPLENLESTLREHMTGLGIDTLFQSRDVFNKKKRVLLFDFEGSFMDGPTRGEILRQGGIAAHELQEIYPAANVRACLAAALSRLEGVPVRVIEKLAAAFQVTPGTAELIQTLKTMGYQVTVRSNALTLFTDVLRECLGIDHCYGVEAAVDEDAMTLIGEISAEQDALDPARIINDLVEREGVTREDITIVTDNAFGESAPPGIHIVFDVRMFLDFLNQHILSPESLTGALGAFGAPVRR